MASPSDVAALAMAERIAGAQAFLPAAFNAPGAKKILFKGHCSESDVSELARASGDNRSVVIGMGGGALLDTAKALARRLGLPVVAIPTIAADELERALRESLARLRARGG